MFKGHFLFVASFLLLLFFAKGAGEERTDERIPLSLRIFSFLLLSRYFGSLFFPACDCCFAFLPLSTHVFLPVCAACCALNVALLRLFPLGGGQGPLPFLSTEHMQGPAHSEETKREQRKGKEMNARTSSKRRKHEGSRQGLSL